MNNNTKSTPNRKTYSIISSFAVGVVFATLIFFSTYFKGKLEYIKIAFELIEALDLKRDTFEKQVPRKIQSVNDYLNQKASFLVSDPIPDDLVSFYKYSLDSLKRVTIGSSRQNSSNDGNWVYIPINDLLAYCAYLKLPRFKDTIQGLTIYMGLITKNNLPADIYKNNSEYFDKKEGTIIPMFVATQIARDSNGIDYLTPYPHLFATDCNCGNPPSCDKGEPDAHKACIGKEYKCDNCPKIQ